METVDLSDPEHRAGEIVRRVRERHEAIGVTLRGMLVARIMPIMPEEKESEAARRSAEVWARLVRVAEQASAARREGVAAVESVREQRREL